MRFKKLYFVIAGILALSMMLTACGGARTELEGTWVMHRYWEIDGYGSVPEFSATFRGNRLDVVVYDQQNPQIGGWTVPVGMLGGIIDGGAVAVGERAGGWPMYRRIGSSRFEIDGDEIILESPGGRGFIAIPFYSSTFFELNKTE